MADHSPSRGLPLPYVLLVDDDENLRGALTLGLRAQGFPVTGASSAAEALAAFADLTIRIDVIVMDLMLPDSWGSQVAMERTLYRPETPVLFISGFAPSDDVLAASTTGADVPFLEKPFTISELAEAILDVVAQDGRAG